MCEYQPLCSWFRLNEDGTQNKLKKLQVRLVKNTFYYDNIFGMMELKGSNFVSIIAQYLKSISAKFGLEKVKQDKVRAF